MIFPLDIFFVFILGLIMGSFINAWAGRIIGGESVWHGRSHCPHCLKTLLAKDLVPLLSWLKLRGRCRFCQQPISWQYPLVELATALIFMAVYWFDLSNGGGQQWWLILRMLRDLIAVSVLIVIFITDLSAMIIADQTTLPALILIFILNLFLGFSWLNLLIGLIVGGGFFGLQYILSRGKWIGGGDLRLGALLGVLLSWPVVIVAVFLAYLIGAMAAIWLLLTGRAKRQTQLPLGVFLAPAGIFCLLYGQMIWNFYWRFLTG